MAQAAAAGGLPTSDRAHKSIAVPVSGTALLLIDVINDLASTALTRWLRRQTISPAARTSSDVNAVIGGFLRDLAFAQSSQQKMFGYKRAAAAILALDMPLTDALGPGGALPRIAGIGPGSTRIIREILETGGTPTVERAIDESGRRGDIERRRQLRGHFLSRAEVSRILTDPTLAGPTRQQYRGDLQMHSEWSDGYPTVQEIADACIERGYQYAAVTDHSHGLKIAGGMSMAEAAEQRTAIEEINAAHGSKFRLLQGIEANIDALGKLDLSDEEVGTFDVVLAAPHSRLRKTKDQADRMLAAIAHPAVQVLAHPRGRITGSRGRVVADWDAVFASAARCGVSLPWTAMRTRPRSSRTPKRPSPTPGSPQFPPTESSTAGRSINF